MANNEWMKEAFIVVNQVFPHDDRKGFDVAPTLIPVDSMHNPPRELLPSEKQYTKFYAPNQKLVKLFTVATVENHILVTDSLWELQKKLTQARKEVGSLKR